MSGGVSMRTPADNGERGSKTGEILRTSFMDGPLPILPYNQLKRDSSDLNYTEVSILYHSTIQIFGRYSISLMN